MLEEAGINRYPDTWRKVKEWMKRKKLVGQPNIWINNNRLLSASIWCLRPYVPYRAVPGFSALVRVRTSMFDDRNWEGKRWGGGGQNRWRRERTSWHSERVSPSRYKPTRLDKGIRYWAQNGVNKRDMRDEGGTTGWTERGAGYFMTVIIIVEIFLLHFIYYR